MTNQELKQSIWKDAAQNGLVLGLALTFIVVITIITELDIKMPYAGSVVQHVVMIVLLMNFCKKRGAKYGAAGFSYGQNMNFILATMLFTGIINGVSTFILQQYIAPEYYQKVIELTLEQSAQQADLTQSQDELMSITMAMMKNPVIVVISGIFGMIINGGFLGIFTSIFTRRLPEPMEQEVPSQEEQEDENNTNPI